MHAGHDTSGEVRRSHHHARAYRELSLLVPRRLPGREAYPADIFYPIAYCSSAPPGPRQPVVAVA